MKKIVCICLMILFVLPGIAFAQGYHALPEIFQLSVEISERIQGNKESLVHKEYLHTANASVNADIARKVDAYDEQYAPHLAPEGHKHSRLDVSVIYYRTGEKYLSTLVFARDSLKKENRHLDFQTALYDLETGKQIQLGDLISDAEGFRKAVLQQLKSFYSGEAAEYSKLEAMTVNDFDFTISALELTIHVKESLIYPDKKGVLHARFMYPDFPYYNELGKKVGDNSKWKFIALTFDDGPKEVQSKQTLDALRKVGARATYFMVGTQIEKSGYLLQQQASENHIIANHSQNHWNGYTIKNFSRRQKEIDMVEEQLQQLLGRGAAFFRAPGGVYPPWAEAKIGLPIIQWSLDTYDYTGKPARRIFYSVRNKAQHGDIVLLHDTGYQTHKAIPLIGEWLTNNGFMMVSLEELAAYYGIKPKANEVYWSFREGENRESKQK